MKDEIINLEEELRLVMLAGDVDKLDELISDSLIFIAPNGDVVTKYMDLDCHRTKLQQMTKMLPSEQVINLYGDYAVVSVKMDISGSFGNESIDGNYRYIRTWAQQNGSWQVIAGSVTKIV